MESVEGKARGTTPGIRKPARGAGSRRGKLSVRIRKFLGSRVENEDDGREGGRGGGLYYRNRAKTKDEEEEGIK